MPDELVRDLIAHELAHVYQSSQGVFCIKQSRGIGRVYVDRDGQYAGDKDAIEDHANELIDEWGFDSCSISDWFHERDEARRAAR
jgi:hypothetical protein